MPGVELLTPFNSQKQSVDALSIVDVGRVKTSVSVLADKHLVTINFNDLRPGDVILFRDTGKKPGIEERIIRAYQTTVCGEENAKWQHVAILDALMNVWDAMPKLNVRCRPLRELLCEQAEIIVMRPRISIIANHLDNALLRLSNGSYKLYSMQTGALLAARLGGRSLPSHETEQRFKRIDRNVICSSFVTNVLRMASKHPFFRELLVVVPADFRNDPDFAPVPLRWCRLAS